MFEHFKTIVEEYNSIILLSHFNPDGDAYGSQIGLREVLKATYKDKKVYAVGSGIKDYFSYIGEMDEVSDETFTNSLVILLDANELYRFEDQRLHTAQELFLIDHHVKNVEHTIPKILDHNVSSTCELVTRIVKSLNFKISKKAANALLLGIITDSGRFQYSTNYQELFKTAAFLCKKGANPDQIFKLINVVKPIDIKLRSFVSSHYVLEDGLIYVKFEASDLKKLNVTANKALSFINSIGNIEGYPIWMMYVKEENGDVIFEFRSSKYEVQPVAFKYGGGGHLLAAGLTIKKCSEEQIETIKKDLINLLEK